MSSDIFDYLVETNGRPHPAAAPPADFRDRMRGRMPDLLVDFLHEQGIGSWGRGRFQFCDPDDLQDILETIFAKDRELDHKDCIAIGYTSFGILILWSNTYQNVKVSLTRGEVQAPRLVSGETVREDIALTSNLMGLDGDSNDQFDEDGKLLFDRAVKKLGPLALGECFGFTPALSFGGSATLENVKKQPAVAHLGFLAQTTSFRLMDYSKRPPYVRDVG